MRGKPYRNNGHGAGMYGRETKTTGHICGNCRWENKGREDCKNNIRAAQVTPYMEEDDE